ncbi:MAG: right-handed parallel beta-helix repeat-containing protein [Planctomycetes bacterium]|nr:right-handed parallel beta-helix repeat-containing protein [Planctomycetota bacterium]MBL7144012.1 right-handed parallel beta-helix repeat-containing protein [Phycisphaerae bacterium]
MKQTYRAIVILLAAVVIMSIFGIAAGQGGASQRLAGARPVIDAGRYVTIQAAIDALPDEGGVVHLPPGTFEISEPLKVTKSDVLIQGAGTATHIKNVNTEGKSALILQHPGGGDNRQAELWRIQLSNFRITGNEKSGHGIEANRINEIFIDGVTVSYHGGDGIRLYFCYEDPRICDSLMTYNKKTGLNVIGCHDVVVSANQFEENHDALRFIDGFNLCMTGNNLDDHLGCGVVIENTYGSVVSGNMIEECAGTAIVLDRDCYGIALSANVIAHNSSGGIDLRDAHGCAVSANTFTISGPDALTIGPNSGRITVTGNNFSNSYLGDGKVKRAANDLTAAGMVLEGTSDVTVVGNLFSSVRPKALAIKGRPSKGVLFGDNVLVDVSSDHKKLDASLVEDNLEVAR